MSRAASELAVVCLLCLGLAEAASRRRVARRSAYARVGGPRGAEGANASRRVVWPLRGTGRTYVHVVGTRFCLNQGHQAALVEARLLLFERICVPTMAQQSTDRFVWVVIVDETLAPRHRRRLATILDAHRGPKDFRVVSLDRETTQNEPNAEGDQAFGLVRLRQPSIVADYVLTTVLDADDGLPYQALRTIRDEVADAVRRVQRNATLRGHEVIAVACYTDAFNWQPSTQSTAGALHLHNESMCITPGLTRVVPWRARPQAWFAQGHALIKARWPGAKTCTLRAKRAAVAVPIRSRTATSTGMRDVVRAADVPASNVYRWRPVLQAQFDITTGDLEAANRGLAAHEAAIARAQMRSNCHGGWSCKEVALAKLRDMSRGARRLAAAPGRPGGPGRRGRRPGGGRHGAARRHGAEADAPSHAGDRRRKRTDGGRLPDAVLDGQGADEIFGSRAARVAGHCRHWVLTDTVVMCLRRRGVRGG